MLWLYSLGFTDFIYYTSRKHLVISSNGLFSYILFGIFPLCPAVLTRSVSGSEGGSSLGGDGGGGVGSFGGSSGAGSGSGGLSSGDSSFFLPLPLPLPLGFPSLAPAAFLLGEGTFLDFPLPVSVIDFFETFNHF